MMKSFYFYFLFSFVSIASIGQNYVDLAKFHYSNTPHTSFDSIGINETTQVQEMGADIMLPIQLDSNNTILAGLFLEKIKSQFEAPLGKQYVSTINLKIGFNTNHSKKWNGTYMLLPKLSSNFQTSITHKDFQLGALVLMKYKRRENFKYHIGLYYNNDLFGPFFVPLLGIYYKSPNDKLEINMTLPIWADINYRFSKILTVGSNFTAFVKSYNLSNTPNYIVKKTNEIFGYLQFNINKSLLLQTKVGYSIGRTFRKYDKNEQVDVGISAFRFGDKRNVINADLNDGLVFKVRLLYRYNL